MIKIESILKIGDKYNNLEVIDLTPEIIDRRQQIRVQCKCGKQMYIRPDRLIQGRPKSCWDCAVEDSRFNKRTVFAGDLCSKMFSDIKRNAKIRNIEFDLTIEFLWELFLKQNKKCVLSGLDIKLDYIKRNKPKAWQKITASLDRIDSYKGYTKDNVQWVHKSINIMKGAMSDSFFIFICNKVAQNHNFKYDNVELNLENGWMFRKEISMNRSIQESATTSSQSNPNNNENHERPTSQVDENIV